MKIENLEIFLYLCSMLINEQTRAFIRQHRDDDVRRLALQGARDESIDLPMALQQIAGWQTARKKLPSWAANEGIVYPPHLNMEQCSSEQTARYKQQLVARLVSEGRVNDSIDADEMDYYVDLTGGLGVDFYWMSQGFKQRCYVEQNAELCTLAEHNFRELGLACSVCRGTASAYLTQMQRVGVVFIDPARRNEQGGRTYSIEDCTPNVLELMPELLKKAHFIVIKLSPMLDWRKAASDLKHVQEVHIVSVANECKELLLVLSQEHTEQLTLTCVNDDTVFKAVPSTGTHATKYWYDEYQLLVRTVPTIGKNLVLASESASDSASAAISYLFEPNASIMKAGCFREVEQQFPVRQLSANSHLFVSSTDIDDFPGRKFQIQAISSMNKQELKTVLSDIRQANISVRNFPLSAEQLRKKLKLKDGGDVYIFATTLADGQHRMLICRKIG